MLRKRIIFSLIYDNEFFTQSRNFRLQKVGNLKWLENNYKFQNIAFSLDELIVINATRENKNMMKFSTIVSDLVKDVFIPVCAGGGIRTMLDAENLFKSGADKIIINSMVVDNPNLVELLVKRYGSQSVVVSIDYKKRENKNIIFINDGIREIDYDLDEYINYVQSLGVGEIYLNSIDKDGTGFGYDFETINKLEKNIKIPLIIAGGAGNEMHLIEGLKIEGVSAVATANLFNFIGDGIPNARLKIIQAGLNITNWEKYNLQ
jgi:cyclase